MSTAVGNLLDCCEGEIQISNELELAQRQEDSLGWEVQMAIVLALEATPALIPEGESSKTRHFSMGYPSSSAACRRKHERSATASALARAGRRFSTRQALVDDRLDKESFHRRFRVG